MVKFYNLNPNDYVKGENERIDAIRNMIKYDVSKEKILQDYSEEEYNEAIKSMLVEA